MRLLILCYREKHGHKITHFWKAVSIRDATIRTSNCMIYFFWRKVWHFLNPELRKGYIELAKFEKITRVTVERERVRKNVAASFLLRNLVCPHFGVCCRPSRKHRVRTTFWSVGWETSEKLSDNRCFGDFGSIGHFAG